MFTIERQPIRFMLYFNFNFNCKSLKRHSASTFVHVLSLLEPVSYTKYRDRLFFFDKSAIKDSQAATDRDTDIQVSLTVYGEFLSALSVRDTYECLVRSRFYSDFLICQLYNLYVSCKVYSNVLYFDLKSQQKRLN